jgi:predicted flap endonuclease-1-like 5' DNA nuclease
MLKGFLSYAREDASDLSVDLERQFGELDEDGVVRFWIDRELRTGDEWERKLLRELSKADVVLVVVTPRAMERSSYVRTTELPLVGFHARTRNLIVIPALAKKVHWKVGPLAELQACPTPPWITDPSIQQARTEWAHSVAVAVRAALYRAEQLTEVRREIEGAATHALRSLDEFEAALAKSQPRLRQRAVVGTVRLLESIRHTVRAPAQDLLEDGPLAVRVAEKLLHAVADDVTLRRSAVNLVNCVDALVVEAAGLRFDFEVDHDSRVPGALDWAKHQTELAAIEAATNSLEEEVQYIKQKRRFEPSSKEKDEIYTAVAIFTERKNAIIFGELEEEKVDIELVERQSGQITEMARGFVAALAADRGVTRQTVEADESRFIDAAQGLNGAVIRARNANAPDDLKRIRGTGVLIEKKLNSLGVTRYDQIARWTNLDIERISQVLDFKGRIERENWVEQASILAAGGITEFARRLDREEVEAARRPDK